MITWGVDGTWKLPRVNETMAKKHIPCVASFRQEKIRICLSFLKMSRVCRCEVFHFMCFCGVKWESDLESSRTPTVTELICLFNSWVFPRDVFDCLQTAACRLCLKMLGVCLGSWRAVWEKRKDKLCTITILVNSALFVSCCLWNCTMVQLNAARPVVHAVPCLRFRAVVFCEVFSGRWNCWCVRVLLCLCVWSCYALCMLSKEWNSKYSYNFCAFQPVFFSIGLRHTCLGFARWGFQFQKSVETVSFS